MNDFKLSIPVAFFIFNRPDTTERVFAEIARARPPKLLVIADGPRANRANEAEKCAAARAIIEQVDWDCQVLTRYAEVNLGCKQRVSSGLNWVFQTVDEAIILEDDCLPHPTFFRFCEELLERYRQDERIMMVSGNNFQFGRKRTEYSYYFSRYSHTWGWASWKRAWQHYDVQVKLWPIIRDNHWLEDILGDNRAAKYWEVRFEECYNGLIDTWDFQWAFACWAQSGLSILPNVNLVSNIGFQIGATHTTRRNRLANMPIEAMDFPLHHPPFTIRDTQADNLTEKKMLSSTAFRHLAARVKNSLSDLSERLIVRKR